MLKIFLCVVLVVLCTAAGVALTQKYKQRKVFMHDLHCFNERLLGEVSYTRLPLSSFFDKYEYGKDFTSVLQEIKQNRFERVKIEFRYLADSQKQLVHDYFSMIGKSDARSQENYLNAVRGELEKEKTCTEAEYKKYFGLYTKLGFLFGLIIVILLI